MKKIIIIIIIVGISSLSLPARGYCFLDWIVTGVSWLSGQWNNLWGGAKNAFGWGEQSKAWGQLMANYREATQFYNDVDYFSKNPQGAMQEFADQFKNELTNPIGDLYSDVQDRSYEQKGLLGKSKDITFEYLDKNANFSKMILANLEKDKERIIKKTDELQKTAPGEPLREKARDELTAELVKLQLQNNYLQAKILELQNKQLELQALEEARNRQYAEDFAKAAAKWRQSKEKREKELGWGKE